MQRRIWSLLIIGSLLATMALWTSQGKAAQGTPVASPTSGATCNALFDYQSVTSLQHSHSESWSVYVEINAGKAGWLTKSGDAIKAVSDEFRTSAEELRALPTLTDEGDAYAEKMADLYQGLSQMTMEVSQIDKLSDRDAILFAYSDPLLDISEELTLAWQAIIDRCGLDNLTWGDDGSVYANGTPIAAPAATPKP